eukprot:4449344-Amphidinium_carterae.1
MDCSCPVIIFVRTVFIRGEVASRRCGSLLVLGECPPQGASWAAGAAVLHSTVVHATGVHSNGSA